MSLRAAWLGSWIAPWSLGRGRRWGDRAWALAAIAQAWLLGGRDRRWPVGPWQGTKPLGPRPDGPPQAFEPQPRPEWISLLRHGSPATNAARRGRQEDELESWCWEALREGDGAPWMSFGAVLLDLPTRRRWIPVLAAVDQEGRLELPPFLETLVPAELRCLPKGWWERLLGGMDSGGRLLPDGSPPPGPLWEALGRHSEPLVLRQWPAALDPAAAAASLHPIASGGWVIDPALRAWGRGFGATPEALAGLRPAAPAWGDEPGEGILRDLLRGRLEPSRTLPPEWREAIAADLADERPSTPPPPLGDPCLDRLRCRWGGAFPPEDEAYPAPGRSIHPCGDPFHWMAEGERAFRAHDPDSALWAFAWAHAHFLRLGSPVWARRAAANAAQSSIHAGDLRGLPFWIKAQGLQPSPFREQNEAILELVRGHEEEALAILRALTRSHPDWPYPWAAIAHRALARNRRDWIEEALPHLPEGDLRRLLEAALRPMRDPAPEDLNGEDTLLWEHQRLVRGTGQGSAFWAAWEACPNRLLRLEEGLRLLERLPAERTPEHLLALQTVADRSGSAPHLERLRGLWPVADAGRSLDPLELVRAWLASRSSPTFLRFGDPPIHLSSPQPPPAGLCSRLAEDGALGPLQVQGQVWWGFPLLWEGAPVGAALVALAPDQPMEAPVELQLLAPWVARLSAPAPLPLPPRSGDLLTDGSEPMATLLRDMARIAPSELPVLLLGPTGSGKELCARELHTRSGRLGPFVAVNCSAFAEGVMESELFGHVKGAFTGADRERKGAIESAQGGTLLLDEVADLSPRLQSLFLRVLQEREVRRVGSDQARKVDVRFVAATHKPLEDLVASGHFRQDLWFRLQGAVLRLPSLRERRHELPYLMPRLVALLARDLKREPPVLAPGLAQALARLPWPGNVREFRHAIERALLRCEEATLRPDHFPELAIPVLAERTWTEANRAFQRRLLVETLRQHRFRAAEAAQALGFARPALYTAMRRLGVDLAAERELWEGDDGQRSS